MESTEVQKDIPENENPNTNIEQMINMGIQMKQSGMQIPNKGENISILKENIFNIKKQIQNIEMKINKNDIVINNNIPINNNIVKNSKIIIIDFARTNGEHDYIQLNLEDAIDEALKQYLIEIKKPELLNNKKKIVFLFNTSEL